MAKDKRIEVKLSHLTVLVCCADEYLRALNLSDPKHPGFADSGADVVASLWELAPGLRKTARRIIYQIRHRKSYAKQR